MVNHQKDKEERPVQIKQQLEYIWKHKPINNVKGKARWRLSEYDRVEPHGGYHGR
jgi:hypothetical protein